MDSTSEASGSSGTSDQCALFIDDSNLFIEGQKYYARQLNLRVPQDPRCRIDMGKLMKLVVGGRKLCHGKLYGSEAPALDTVWKAIREHQLEVDVFRKDFKGKEKEVDTAITADGVAYAMESTAHKLTVIIVAGDRDYCPLVKMILKKKHNWKIELVAFKRSISKQIRDIQGAKLKIIEFETLLETGNCCFIEARYRADRIRIPKNRTIILRFKERLISAEADDDEKTKVNQLLKLYAEEITLITGVPCFYHLCKWEPNTDRWVYIIGYSFVKAEPGSTGIDFFRICREKEHQLNQKCLQMCEKYEGFKTAMESDESMCQNKLQLTNRFSGLGVEEVAGFSDEYILSHIYDDADSVIEATESLDEENVDQENADGGGEDANAEGFTEVKRSSKVRKPAPKYSIFCSYEFSCLKGQRCDYTHTPKQVEFFKSNNGKGVMGYKSKPCCHFSQGRCNYGQKKLTPNCAYYHSIEEARCYVCKNNGLKNRYIGHASHDDMCPSRSSGVNKTKSTT